MFTVIKKIIFVVILFASIKSIAQTKELFFDYNWRPCESSSARFYCKIDKTDSGYVRKDFFLREKSLQMIGKYEDEESKIPNGYFRYYHANQELSSIGRYVHGKKEGLWLHFYSNGMMSDSIIYQGGAVIGTTLSWYKNGYMKDSSVVSLDGNRISIGWFENGNISYAGRFNNQIKPEGVWKFYHSNGKISAKELYNNGKLLDKEYFNENGEKEIDTTSKDRAANYPNGINAWGKYLANNCYFPAGYSFINGNEAVVVVSFAIDENGKVTDIEVTDPLHPEFDKIAVNVLKKSKDWLPAIEHNRKVKFTNIQAIHFSQKED